ncbi:MAG: AAA family ATPase [Chloroflexi bacterium]|nr:AAA family ATPase [Chloroflexota bacterium]
MFCDLQGSTALSQRLDPEELRDLIRSYQDVCGGAVGRFEGHIAKYLGDGLLVYFGYPQAHEDDPQRAVRSGLAILEDMGQLNIKLKADKDLELGVRIGIHTGLVVAGEMGGGDTVEALAIVGETPNIAARLQEAAQPNSVVISDVTANLIQGFFLCEDLGLHELKGISQPMELFQVVAESGAQSRFDVAAASQLTPLVGKEQELGLLLDRWEQAKEGLGQVVLLSGEAGIGKSRLVETLTQRLAEEPHVLRQLRCSAYHQNSVLYPVIDFIERWLEFSREDSPEEKLGRLERALSEYRFPLPEAVPLLAGLLSVPLDHRYTSPTLTAEGQREETLALLVALWMESPGGHPVFLVIEDLHWADPSTLELLGLLVDQAPTARMLAIFSFRPEFTPAWGGRAHLTQITLNRLTRRLAVEMVGRLAGDKALPEGVVDQVVSKSDGVPLFVEELTRMVTESGPLRETDDRHEVTGPLPSLAIPYTLQDSLTARLDRLGAAREVAQLGAVLGREFSYELIQAVSPLEEGVLRSHLQQLVAAEFLYQRGLHSEVTFIFKHNLVQDASYESLLRSARRQYHRTVAEVLEVRFHSTVETQPELVARHFMEAGLTDQAVPYLQKAGDRALANYANQEALAYFQQALAVKEGQPMDEQMADALFGLGRSQLATSQPGALQTGVGNLILAFDYYVNAGNVARAVTIAEHPLPTGAFLLEDARLLVARALTLVEGESHEAGRLAVRAGMYLGRMSRDYEGAQESFGRSLRIARREGDVDLELLALANMAEVDLFHLQLEQCQRNVRQAIETAQRVNNLQAEVQAHQRAVLASIVTGNSEDARLHASAGLDRAERLHHRWWLTTTLWGNQTVSQLVGDWRDAREFGDRGLAAAPNDLRMVGNRALLEYEAGRDEHGDIFL